MLCCLQNIELKRRVEFLTKEIPSNTRVIYRKPKIEWTKYNNNIIFYVETTRISFVAVSILHIKIVQFTITIDFFSISKLSITLSDTFEVLKPIFKFHIHNVSRGISD